MQICAGWCKKTPGLHNTQVPTGVPSLTRYDSSSDSVSHTHARESEMSMCVCVRASRAYRAAGYRSYAPLLPLVPAAWSRAQRFRTVPESS